MRLSPTRLMTQSIVYSFSRGFPWFFVFIGALGSLALTFLYDKYVPLYSVVEYAYECAQTIFSTWWYLLVSQKVLSDLNREDCSMGKAAKMAVSKTVSVWWLIVWLTLLQWATVPLLQRPYCYGVGADLILFLLIMIILIIQLFLNFSMIPAIADGHLSFKKLYIDALDFVRRQFVGLIYLFALFAVTWGGLMLATSFLVFLIKGASEGVVTVCWQQEIAKVVIISIATSIATLFIAVSQTLFYYVQNNESARWEGERHSVIEV